MNETELPVTLLINLISLVPPGPAGGSVINCIVVAADIWDTSPAFPRKPNPLGKVRAFFTATDPLIVWLPLKVLLPVVAKLPVFIVLPLTSGMFTLNVEASPFVNVKLRVPLSNDAVIKEDAVIADVTLPKDDVCLLYTSDAADE